MSFLRAIEKKIRRAILNRSGGAGRIGPEDPLPVSVPDAPRILLLRLDRIGDAIISTPALLALRRRFPTGRIDVLLGAKNRTVAPLLPAADNVYVLPKRITEGLPLLLRLRRSRYDVAVNLHLNRSASASTAAGLVRPGVVIESPLENAFAAEPEAQEHAVVMTARLLRPLGVEAVTPQNEGDNPLRLELPADAVRRAGTVLHALAVGSGTDVDDPGTTSAEDFILLNVSATHTSRNWPAERFAELAAGLRSAGLNPVLCGAPADAERVRRIAAGSGARALPPLNDYADFAAVAARAAAVITPDTSTVHLAAALGRPTVALYGSARTPSGWRPWGVPHRIIRNPDGMEKIQPKEVLAALQELPGSGVAGTDQQEQHDSTARTEIPTRSV